MRSQNKKGKITNIDREMSAFNDYCIVCGQMINGVGVCGHEHDRLYCSASCREDDRINLENLKLSNELAGTPADLIRSPLLQPVDYRGNMGSGEGAGGYVTQNREEDLDLELEASLDGLMAEETENMISIPRSLLSNCLQYGREKYDSSVSRSKANMVSDHTAEENYKLWLNYNFTG